MWERLSGKERVALYEEYVEAGYAGPSPYVPNFDKLAKANTPKFPEACPKKDLPSSFIQYAEKLGEDGPWENVAALVLLFECCSIEDRQVIANLLLEVLKHCE